MPPMDAKEVSDTISPSDEVTSVLYMVSAAPIQNAPREVRRPQRDLRPFTPDPRDVVATVGDQADIAFEFALFDAEDALDDRMADNVCCPMQTHRCRHHLAQWNV